MHCPRGHRKRGENRCALRSTSLPTSFGMTTQLIIFAIQALGVLKEKAVIFHGWAEDSQREGEEL